MKTEPRPRPPVAAADIRRIVSRLLVGRWSDREAERATGRGDEGEEAKEEREREHTSAREFAEKRRRDASQSPDFCAQGALHHDLPVAWRGADRRALIATVASTMAVVEVEVDASRIIFHTRDLALISGTVTLCIRCSVSSPPRRLPHMEFTRTQAFGRQSVA